MTHSRAEQDLLFALLAVRKGLLTFDQVLMAGGCWLGNRQSSLGDILAGQFRLLSPEQRAEIEALAAHVSLPGKDEQGPTTLEPPRPPAAPRFHVLDSRA